MSCYMTVTWAKRKPVLCHLAHLATFCAASSTNFYLLPPKSRRSWVTRVSLFWRTSVWRTAWNSQVNGMDSTGSHPFPAVPKVVACSGLPWMAVSQRVPGAGGAAQAGGKITCALKRSLTHVSSDAVLLYRRPKTFGGLTSWSRRVPSEQASSLWWGAVRGLIWSLPHAQSAQAWPGTCI